MIPKGEMDEEALAVPMRAWVIGFASIVTGALGLFLFSAHQGLERGLPEKIDDIIEAHNRMRPDNFKEPSIANWGAKQLMASVTEGSPIRDYEILNIRTMFPLSQARVTLSLKLEDGRSQRVRLYFVGYTCNGAFRLDKEDRSVQAPVNGEGAL